ncbi:MAG TPA: phosphohistidine phosphatase SixA [Dissulfurispiraceae bacterium]|nr:phosphohistidine phosphatase SixA [Dissulfurispiraceae bacterium]
MLLYLVRHGEANSELFDPSQALSERGLREVQKVAAHLAGINSPVELIFHSPKLRARQTAAVFADYLRPSDGIFETDHLGPLDDPSEWERRLRDRNKNIMLVGHLPYMEKLFSLLLCGFIDDHVVNFGNAAIVCLRREKNGTWVLHWMLGPAVVAH